MRRARAAFVCIAIAAVLAGVASCPSTNATPRPAAAISMQLGTRGSCGLFSGLDYDTSCMAAVDVVVRDAASRAIVIERCTPLEGRTAELGQLLRGEALSSFGGLSTTRAVLFEVRGLHDKTDATSTADAGTDACADRDATDRWLFWGSSDPVDLTVLDDDGGTVLVPIVVDCRDCAFDCPEGDCFGCAGLGSETCPARMPTSFCVPAVGLQCNKRCDDDGDCFEGARRCDVAAGTCDTREATGTLCAPCRFDVDAGVVGCNEGYSCVAPPGARQGFCAPSCPDAFCVSGTRCNRVGNDLAVVGSDAG